jgi:hypothetical protein
MVRSREEHVEWAKARAMEYVVVGDFNQAIASMGSDLNKHPETTNHPGMMLGMIELMGNPTKESITRFIQGFN